MTTITITKKTDLKEIVKFIGNSDEEFLLMPKSEAKHILDASIQPAMTKEEALETLMAELQKGLDSGAGIPIELVAKEFGVKL
ncbi:MAG: hypothetical protein FWB72_02210 [Firmicutes bacterium]|nr:hypothetical protein [Bacillota bacterium]